jgi:hypothetical protein
MLFRVIFILKIPRLSQVPVAHTCNRNFSRGIDQEDHSSKPAQANSSQNPISKKPYLKKTHHKKELVEWLKM